MTTTTQIGRSGFGWMRQIAKDSGAEVWGTASPSKHEAIKANGVQHPIDYTVKGWEKGLPDFDLVIDAVGGSSFKRSYELLRAGGRLVCFGASSVVSGEGRNLVQAGKTILTMPKFNLVKQMSASKAVIGLNMLALWDEFGTLRPWIEPLLSLADSGAILPVIAAEVPFDNAPEAHRMLSERRNIGKVVLVP